MSFHHLDAPQPLDLGVMAIWQRVRAVLFPSSLRGRLVLVSLSIDMLAALSAVLVVLWEGRAASRLEMASAMRLAQSLASDSIWLMQDAPLPILLQNLVLQFQGVRHVRVAVQNASGEMLLAKPRDNNASDAQESTAPSWFIAIIAPALERKSLPIVVRGRNVGTATITSAPGDEAAEAWSYAKALLAFAVLINLLVLFALYLFFGRILAPLQVLAQGLQRLTERKYAVRLPSSPIEEIDAITVHFNRAAETLAVAQRANSKLHRKLLTAQDDERRRTALELHDEAGVCLFALEASAASIAAQTSNEAQLVRIHETANDVVSLVSRVQEINRRILDRLRPMALGRIPLRENLLKLTIDLNHIDKPTIALRLGALRDSYGFLVDLTIYRCTQEGLLNAMRHAHATHVVLEAFEDRSEWGLGVTLRVRDDGHGLPQNAQSGFGLAGMRERVEALDGNFRIDTGSAGTTLHIFVPLEEALQEVTTT